MSERLPFLDEPKKQPLPAVGNYDKRIVELLEAIDWKLWMLYNMVSRGELIVELDKNPDKEEKIKDNES